MIELFILIIIFSGVVFYTSREYKRFFDRNLILTWTTFLVGVSEILFIIGWVYACDISIHEDGLEMMKNVMMFSEHYERPALFIYGSLVIGVGSVIMNVVRSNIIIGLIQIMLQMVISIPLMVTVLILINKIKEYLSEEVI